MNRSNFLAIQSWVMSPVPLESYGSGDSFPGRFRSAGLVLGDDILDTVKNNDILVGFFSNNFWIQIWVSAPKLKKKSEF